MGTRLNGDGWLGVTSFGRIDEGDGFMRLLDFSVIAMFGDVIQDVRGGGE